ncbi:hypothetical protein [Streptomyces sp. NPDC054958]
MPRPDLFRIRDWTTEGYAYRAEPYAYAPNPIVSPRPVLDQDPGLPETWWKEMVAALDSLADVPPPTSREAVREEYLRRVIPEFTGHQVEDVTWTTAHGDLHYGNVTRGPHILDRLASTIVTVQFERLCGSGTCRRASASRPPPP